MAINRWTTTTEMRDFVRKCEDKAQRHLSDDTLLACLALQQAIDSRQALLNLLIEGRLVIAENRTPEDGPLSDEHFSFRRAR